LGHVGLGNFVQGLNGCQSHPVGVNSADTIEGVLVVPNQISPLARTVKVLASTESTLLQRDAKQPASVFQDEIGFI
jgi:hypothetical protein